MNLILVALTYISLISNALADEKLCTYGKDNHCPKNQICIKYEQTKDVCRNKFDKELKTISYPFSSSTSSFCDQGPLAPSGNSHTWQNTAFAVDIKSYSKANEDILAGVDGTIIAYGECETENDQCGLGFGNQIKILTEDNFIVFYAHLKNISVKTGDIVKKGSVIGTVGLTGWTGKDNKHLHLSVHYDWKSAGLDYWKNVGYLPNSVPFRIKDCNGKFLSVENLDCKRTVEISTQFCTK